MRSSQGLELRDDTNVLAELELRGELLLERLEPQLFQPGDLGGERGLVREVGQRAASPEPERLGQDPTRGLGLMAVGTGLAEHVLEEESIHLAAFRPQAVAGGARLDRVARERGTDPRDVHSERGPGILREIIPPERIDQALRRDDLVRLEYEVGEHDPLLRASERDRAVLPGDLERPQDGEAHRATVPLARRAWNPQPRRGSLGHVQTLPRSRFRVVSRPMGHGRRARARLSSPFRLPGAIATCLPPLLRARRERLRPKAGRRGHLPRWAPRPLCDEHLVISAVESSTPEVAPVDDVLGATPRQLRRRRTSARPLGDIADVVRAKPGMQPVQAYFAFLAAWRPG